MHNIYKSLIESLDHKIAITVTNTNYQSYESGSVGCMNTLWGISLWVTTEGDRRQDYFIAGATDRLWPDQKATLLYGHIPWNKGI